MQAIARALVNNTQAAKEHASFEILVLFQKLHAEAVPSSS